MHLLRYFILAVKKTLDFQGRTSRKAYWMFVLFSNLIWFFCIFIDNVFELTYVEYSWDYTYSYESLFGPFSTFFGIGAIFPGIALAIRRLHDVNKSGWYILINLIPILGGLIFFFSMIKAGTYGENKYGLEPINELDENKRNDYSKHNFSSEYVAEELKKYKELLDIGAITEEEYNIKKKEILNL